MRAGRDCPLDYRLPQGSFRGDPLFGCSSLYVIGGLYGNLQALDAVERRLQAEPGACAVFNGDAHWFDSDPELFERIEARLSGHTLLRGNVETELGRDTGGDAGCGCAYPEAVDDRVVEWSNRIHARLVTTVAAIPGMRERLAQRSPTALIEVAGHRIAVTHGDECSLAGWRCERDALRDPHRQAELNAWLADQGVSVLATSHTCAPAALQLEHGAVINNGAAGMPNFAASRYGLITRIATTAHPGALYRSTLAGLVIEALPLLYRHEAFIADFDRQWPAGTAAALSYRERITQGTADVPESALLGGFRLASTLCAMEDLH